MSSDVIGAFILYVHKVACAILTTTGLQSFHASLCSPLHQCSQITSSVDIANSCRACLELGWAPWLKSHNRGKLQMKKLVWHHLSLWKSLLFSHSGSLDLSLFGLSFSHLFPAWFFLHFLEGLSEQAQMILHLKWAGTFSLWLTLFQTGAEII